MKKLLTITALTLVASIAACSSPVAPKPSLALKRPSKDQIVEESAAKCETLGFERGTKEFRDCAVTQFNKTQDKYY